MTLQMQNEFTLPEETVRVARAAYPHGNTIIKMRDALGTIYDSAGKFCPDIMPVLATWDICSESKHLEID